jgi:DNA-binding MarR family transcriptional regulator
MKVTKSYLKQVIKEELERMEEAGYVEKDENGTKTREVSITLNGKTIRVSFSEKGGSPLYGGDLEEMSEEEQRMVMKMAAAAAEVRGGFEDYSQEEIDTMMKGGKVSAFKPKR